MTDFEEVKKKVWNLMMTYDFSSEEAQEVANTIEMWYQLVIT